MILYITFMLQIPPMESHAVNQNVLSSCLLLAFILCLCDYYLHVLTSFWSQLDLVGSLSCLLKVSIRSSESFGMFKRPILKWYLHNIKQQLFIFSLHFTISSPLNSLLLSDVLQTLSQWSFIDLLSPY